MRVLVSTLIALAIIFALLLFDEADKGLAIVGVIVWLAVLLAGLLLVLRRRARDRQGLYPRAPRRPRRAVRIALRRAAKPLSLPRR